VIVKIKQIQMKYILLCLSISFSSLLGNAQQKVVNIESQVKQPQNENHALKRKVAIARFSNETEYGKGIFYSKANDKMGKQALDILSTKLAASNKFILLERSDMDTIVAELKKSGNDESQKIGADYLIVGSITEFGRKDIGESKVFSRSVKQIVEAGVSIRLIDVSTGQIVYSEEAKGEAETTDRTVMGLGQKADYDATLSDKAISAAISKLVENIINNCTNRPWKSYFLSDDNDGIIISGGKSQGLKLGDIYEVVQKGKSIRNPQTGMNIELPGKSVGKVKIDFTGGDTPQNEFSMVSFTEGSIDKQNINNYYIKEIR